MHDPKAIKTLREAQQTDDKAENSESRMWPYVNLAGPQLKPWHIVLNENISAVILQSTWWDAISFPLKGWTLGLNVQQVNVVPCGITEATEGFLRKGLEFGKNTEPQWKAEALWGRYWWSDSDVNRPWKRMSEISWRQREQRFIPGSPSATGKDFALESTLTGDTVQGLEART